MDLIAFPYHDWRKGEAESFRTRDGHLLRAFGQHPSVRSLLVVDRPVSLAERIKTRRSINVAGEEIGRRRLGPGWTAYLTRVGPRTSVLDIATPDVIAPVRDPRGWWFDVFASSRVHDALDWAAHADGRDTCAAIAWTPAVVGGVESIHPTKVLFDSLDNWLTHPILRRHAARATDAYRRLLPGASVVVPSEASRQQLASFSDQITVVPNGVDLERFEKPTERPADLPDGPTVGYVGKLGVRIDPELVRATALAMPDVWFVFVGPTLEPDHLLPMSTIPNVSMLGDRRSELVPAYLHAFDIAWIPHRVGEGETGGDLMKKYEYWAAGRQVVTTPVADLDEWAAQLHVIRTPEEAVGVVRGLLDGTRTSTPTVVPPDRTWPAIADVLLQELAG